METRSATTIGVAAALLWGAALVAGCGGDSGGNGAAASCGKVAPCGGSIVGTWAVSSACESPVELTGGAACTGATIDQSQMKVTGSLAFNADMTFATSISQSGTLRFSLPVDCLEPFGGCDGIPSTFTPGPPDATTTCTTMGTTCVCSLVYAGTSTAMSSGTYTTAGTVLTTTDDQGNTADSGYCVQANAFHLVNVDATTGEISDDLVATK
jgi:hypothetical protein